MIQQHFIEIPPRDLIRVIGLRTVAVFEVKFGSSVAARTDDFAAIFFYESGPQKFLVQPQSRKRLHAEWQQRFANMKARELFPLENDYAPTGTSKEGRSRAACGSASNDCDVVHTTAHGLILAKSRRFGRVGASRGLGAAARRPYHFMLLCA